MELKKIIKKNTRKTKYNFHYNTARNCHTNESLKLVEQITNEVVQNNSQRKSSGILKKTGSSFLSKMSSLKDKITTPKTRFSSKKGKTRNSSEVGSLVSSPELMKINEEVVPVFTKRNRMIKSKWDKQLLRTLREEKHKSESQMYDRLNTKRIIESKLSAAMAKLNL